MVSNKQCFGSFYSVTDSILSNDSKTVRLLESRITLARELIAYVYLSLRRLGGQFVSCWFSESDRTFDLFKVGGSIPDPF